MPKNRHAVVEVMARRYDTGAPWLGPSEEIGNRARPSRQFVA